MPTHDIDVVLNYRTVEMEYACELSRKQYVVSCWVTCIPPSICFHRNDIRLCNTDNGNENDGHDAEPQNTSGTTIASQFNLELIFLLSMSTSSSFRCIDSVHEKYYYLWLSGCLFVWCNPYQYTMSVRRTYMNKMKNIALNEWWRRIVKATANKLYATSGYGMVTKKNANVAAAAKVNLLLFAIYWHCNIAYCGRKTIERCHFKFMRCCSRLQCDAAHLSLRVTIKLP